MSINYATLQAALAAWVVSASGLDAEDVAWAYAKYQGGPRPVGTPFVTLRLGPSVVVGLDGTYTTTDLTRPAGEEVEIATIAMRRLVVRVQAWGGLPDGEHSAFAILSRVRDRLALPTIRDALNAAGASPYDPGSVMDVSFIEGTKFESRAVCDVGFYVSASESEFAGFIEWVTGHYTLTSVGTFVGTFDVDAR